MTAIRPELMDRIVALAHAIDHVLISGHGLVASLKAPPSFGAFVDGAWRPAPLEAGVNRYGNGPLLSLWVHCRDLVALRVAWTGAAGPEAAALPEEPDEAPGLAVEAPVPADDGTENQRRLSGT